MGEGEGEAKPINFSAVCKMMWPFARYGHCLSELFCAGRSCASMLQRSPAHYWLMLYISGPNCLGTASVVRSVCYPLW